MIVFTSTERDNSTHRVSDGYESVYFAWPNSADAALALADAEMVEAAIRLAAYPPKPGDLDQITVVN